MFFILSQLLAFVLNPVCWLIFFLIWALFTKGVTRRKRLVGMVLLGSVLLTNPLLIRLAYRCGEVTPVDISSLDKTPSVEAIVLGKFGNDNVEFGDRFEFGESANRLAQALELSHACNLMIVSKLALDRTLLPVKGAHLISLGAKGCYIID